MVVWQLDAKIVCYSNKWWINVLSYASLPNLLTWVVVSGLCTYLLVIMKFVVNAISLHSNVCVSPYIGIVTMRHILPLAFKDSTAMY